MAPLLRRGSCDSLASSAPSLAYTSAVSSPSMSPEIPAFHVPAKFHTMNPSEQAFAEGMGYDSRGQRRPSVISHAQGGRIAKLSPSPPVSHYPSLQPALGGKPRRAPPRPSPTGRGHINTPYAEEQNYWIIYHKVDLGLSWKEIEDRYNGMFPHLGRTDGGLQSTFYRFNDRTPMMTEDRLLVLDDNSPETYAGVGYRTHKVKARSSGKRGEISGRVTLIERYAEQVADRGYKWVHPKDLELARQIGEFSTDHGAALVRAQDRKKGLTKGSRPQGLRRKQQRQEWLRRKAAMRTRMRH